MLSPWEELSVILMNRGMGHISSIPVAMQQFRVGCRAQPGSPCSVGPCCFNATLQSRVLAPLSVSQCGGDARGRLDAWLGAPGNESVLGVGTGRSGWAGVRMARSCYTDMWEAGIEWGPSSGYRGEPGG